MEYLSLKQTAEKWGITVRRVQVLCSQGKIPGAMKIGSFWVAPKEAEKLRSRGIRELRVVNILNLQKNKQYYRGKQ